MSSGSLKSFLELDALVLAAGSGRRFSNDTQDPIPKQFQTVHGISILNHSLLSLEKLLCIRNFIVVAPENQHDVVENEIRKLPMLSPRIRVISGGKERQDSSLAGLRALDATPPDRVLIHDACRPFMSEAFTKRLRNACLDRALAAWIPVIPVTDTIKRVEQNRITETLNRTELVRVQTPQVFEYSVIRRLAEQAERDGKQGFTDDASLCEYYGIPVGTFEGDERGLKLTYGHEIPLLEKWLPASTIDSASASTFTV